MTGTWAGGYGVQIGTLVTGQTNMRPRGAGIRQKVRGLAVGLQAGVVVRTGTQTLASLPHTEKCC